MSDSNHFAVSEEDWSLHRKGYDDQKRHQEKVQEVLKNKLPDLITEENIIMSNGKDLIKIPIRSLDEYKIRYSQDKNKHAGQGKGGSKVGDVLGRAGGQQKAPGKGQGEAGDQPGQDYYEAEVSFEELEENFYSQLELPNLEQKDEQQMIVTDIAFHDIRKTGLVGNIDKKRTMLEAFKRNALSGTAGFAPIYPEDVRYKTWDAIEKPDSKAVVLAMLDTSGSMGNWEKYVARSFFFWMTRFLRTKYETVEIEFIAHHTEANVVDEESFFSKGESGGTICSSAYRKALQLIDEKYPPSAYNIYPFHFSDGDNLTSDNSRCIGLINQLIEKSSMFGYGEVNQYNRHSTLMQIFRKMEHPKFRYYVLRKKTDVFYAMHRFFSNEEAEITV